MPDEQLISSFWPNEFPGVGYLEIILQVVSGGKLPLQTAIRNFPGIVVNRASDIAKVTDQAWIDLFKANPALLPDFTKIGNTEDRATAYIQFLRTLFSVGFQPSTPKEPMAGTIPSYGNYDLDMLAKVFTAIQGGFDLNSFPSDVSIDSALEAALPEDVTAQAFARKALQTIHDLYLITKSTTNAPDQFQFSCMEALFARGFTSLEKVLSLSQEQFTFALQGTVAWGSSSSFWHAASELGSEPGQENEPGHNFQPINPGDLVDCIPPDHLSLIGPIQYLHEVLREESGNVTLRSALENRRGPLGTLLASKQNLELEIPQIDLVNESLEYLGSNLTEAHGMIHDTVHPKVATGDETDEEMLQANLAAMPQYSSPAVSVSSSRIYDVLEDCFTDPALPYNQPLDVCRSYVEMLGSGRMETMRRCRQNITELAMDPEREPSDFQSNQWRYPVRFDIALEHIQMSRREYEKIFSHSLSEAEIALLYGYNSESSWLDRIKPATGFSEIFRPRILRVLRIMEDPVRTADSCWPLRLTTCMPTMLH